jgi:hypothetical protein
MLDIFRRVKVFFRVPLPEIGFNPSTFLFVFPTKPL